ncbi:MAG: epoxyqueuosine reductase QueH [Thermodesulfovibrionales bacterium]|nr:epoxyqueuosine reductase QueH [Thermodesulfovibrionales bacterium]
MLNVLMHICCANCSIYPIMILRENHFNFKCLWFNPNIHPFSEYRERLSSLQFLQKLWDIKVDYIDYYGLIDFTRAVSGSEDTRCEYCYQCRLEETAKNAKNQSFDAFSTSLLVSPYQKFDKIIEIGKDLEKKYNIKFYWEDFRKGFYKGKKISKELGLYQQKYCGCIYSEMDRFRKKVI